MNSIKMDGKALADDILTRLKFKVDNLKNLGVEPSLAIITSGTDAGNVYVNQKVKTCERIGVKCQHYAMSEDSEHIDYIELISKLNEDPTVHGIIVQLPIKGYSDTSPYVRSILNHISYEKDVDGLSESNVANIWADDTVYYEPCTPKGIVRLLKHCLGEISGKHVVIVGRSTLVGKPLAGLLLRENCTVTMCHSKTEMLMRHICGADILVTAMGQPGVITGVPHGIEALVDVSINRDEFGHLVGDVPKYLYKRFKYYTPVPGGVGPMTVAMLMENVVNAAENTIL